MKRLYRLLSCLGLLLLCCVLLFGCKQSATTHVAEDTRQELVFGGDIYPPFAYINEKGELTGIDIEIMHEACRRLGYKGTFKTISWNNKDWLLGDGFVDGLWSCFSMDNRLDEYAWAGPYMETHHVVVVGRHSNVKSLADLEGRRVVVQFSSQPERIFMERSTPEIPAVRDLYSTNNVDALFSSLQMGYADAASCNEIVAQQYQSMFPGDFVILDKPLTTAHVGVAFAKDKQELSKKFNAVLQQMRLDGTITKIVEKYESKENKVGGVNASAATRKKIL